VARQSKKEREQEILDSVLEFVDSCHEQTSKIRHGWDRNLELFKNGSTNFLSDKADWQSKFSLNRVGRAIRTAHGRIREIIVNSPDWYSFEARNSDNNRAAELHVPLSKLFDFYLEESKGRKRFSSIVLKALISIGVAVVTWEQKRVLNPKWVDWKTRNDILKNARNAPDDIENPPEIPAPEDVFESIESAIDDLPGEIQGDPTPESIEPKKYIQYGVPRIDTPEHDDIYWDTGAQYIGESGKDCVRIWVDEWKLHQMGEQGIFDKKKVKEALNGRKSSIVEQRWKHLKKKGLNRDASKKNLIELLVYWGPLIVENEVKEDTFFTVVADRGTILKSGDYPYWEPPGEETPVVYGTIKEVPGQAHGDGMGNAVHAIQKTYDSNSQLICDQSRFNLVGWNVVDYAALVDKSILESGVEPGKTIRVRGNPKEVFNRVEVTSNIENQVKPIQEALRSGIDDETGVNDVLSGAASMRSRTTATEVSRRSEASAQQVNFGAIDLQDNVLVPTLKKVFARVLQFGLSEVRTNPFLSNILSEEEISILQGIRPEERVDILNNFYQFKIKGFQEAVEKERKLNFLSELMVTANSGGVMSMLIDHHEVIKEYLKTAGIDPAGKFVVQNTQMSVILAENKVLLSGRWVEPSDEDDDEMHLQFQSILANSPYATQELIAHVQLTQQRIAERQQAEQEAESQAQQVPQLAMG